MTRHERRWMTGAIEIVGTSIVLLFFMIAFGSSAQGQGQKTSEYQVKAVFLYNFTQFVDWPAASFKDASEPMVIGILGDDPFGPYLDETIAGERVKGHPLQIKRFQSDKDAEQCHILFVNWTKEDHLRQLLLRLKGRNILTVSDSKDFLRNGGIIRFFSENNRVRIRINLELAKAADLTISSKLLKLADVVEPKPN